MTKYFPQGGGLIIEDNPKGYVFGSGQLQGRVIREDGDWTEYLPIAEDQRVRNIETSACVTFATINAIEILMEEMGLGTDFDYSERFISLLSETTSQGNSPTKVADTIRKYGLIPQGMMPFDESIQDWGEFNSWKGADKEKCLAAGRQWLKKYGFGYDHVFTGDHPPEEKHERIREALKYSPLGISVLAWMEDNGVYHKPVGGDDNHWTCSVKHNLVYDSYSPYLKNLKENYDHITALRYVITPKKYEAPVGFFGMLKKLFTWRR